MLTWSLIEAHWYALRRISVPVLPPGTDPVRVLHISDLHLVPGQRRRISWVRDLARLDPDLVINTGDNMAHARSLPAVLEALGPLLDVPGGFVMGSNDYYAAVLKNPVRYLKPRLGTTAPSAPTLPGAELGRAMAAHGWQDLTNRRARIDLPGLQVELAGVDDPHLDRDHLPPPVVGGPPAGRTGPGAASSSGPAATLHLGVTHAPYTRVLEAMRHDGAELILAGHTHGGQLCLPGYGALVTNCDLDTGRAKGLHGWPGPRPDAAGGQDSVWLHVSAGLGTSPYTPVRFACRPEASLLTLVARSSSARRQG